MTDRRERLAKNEALFRDVNERIEEIATEHLDPEVIQFLCECVDVECLARIELSAEAYERLRADSAQFVVTSGHERLEVEDVVDRQPGYLVVRKHPDTRPIVEGRDPRSD